MHTRGIFLCSLERGLCSITAVRKPASTAKTGPFSSSRQSLCGKSCRNEASYWGKTAWRKVISSVDKNSMAKDQVVAAALVRLTDWLIDWLIDWLTDWLIASLQVKFTGLPCVATPLTRRRLHLSGTRFTVILTPLGICITGKQRWQLLSPKVKSWFNKCRVIDARRFEWSFDRLIDWSNFLSMHQSINQSTHPSSVESYAVHLFVVLPLGHAFGLSNINWFYFSV